MAIKTFVLDTNVLLHSAQSIESFQDNDVVIPMAVVEELDKFKKNSDELGRNARQVIRHLDRLRQLELPKTGRLKKGVPLRSINPALAGRLFVLTAAEVEDEQSNRDVNSVFGSELQLDSPDNRILRVAYGLHQQGKLVVFISKDINLRLKADVLFKQRSRRLVAAHVIAHAAEEEGRAAAAFAAGKCQHPQLIACILRLPGRGIGRLCPLGEGGDHGAVDQRQRHHQRHQRGDDTFLDVHFSVLHLLFSFFAFS